MLKTRRGHQKQKQQQAVLQKGPGDVTIRNTAQVSIIQSQCERVQEYMISLTLQHTIPTVFGPIMDRSEVLARKITLYKHEPVGRVLSKFRIKHWTCRDVPQGTLFGRINLGQLTLKCLKMLIGIIPCTPQSPGCLILSLAVFHYMLIADVIGVSQLIVFVSHHHNYLTPLIEPLKYFKS